VTSHLFRLRRPGDGGTNAPPPEECENIIIYVTVTVITIAANAGIAIATFARARFLTSSFGEVSIPDSRLPVLAARSLTVCPVPHVPGSIASRDPGRRRRAPGPSLLSASSGFV
jgi:hypothetical protein